MIEYLKFRFQRSILHNSWLIDSDDTSKALRDLNIFIENHLFMNKILLKNHPDYRLVMRDNSLNPSIKDISVEQIRDLRQFFGKTSSISKYRLAIIYQADLMNLNAANSCLKLLEDTPKNSFIFLITSRASKIINTIRSRCAKISIKSQNILVENNTYTKYIANIGDYSNLANKLDLLKEFSSKNRELWGDFAYNILYLINRITKKSVNINLELTETESKIFERLACKSPDYLLGKFVKIKRIINNTIDYDLDLRASTVELIEELI